MGAALAQTPMMQDHVPAWATSNVSETIGPESIGDDMVDPTDELDLSPFTADAGEESAMHDAPADPAMPVMPVLRPQPVMTSASALSTPGMSAPEMPIPAMPIPAMPIPALDAELVDMPQPDEDAGLADWLASARMLAEVATQAEHRSRRALYEAIGRAHDFALRAMANPSDYREMLADAGIEMQDRAPFTPVAKLIFGVHYDKTRLAEIACALGFAQAQQVQSGQFADYLTHYDGGLKGLIADYRDTRRETGLLPRPDSALDLRDRLRHAPAKDLAAFTGGGAEFVLLIGRRNMHGAVELIGAVEDESATTRMLKKLKP